MLARFTLAVAAASTLLIICILLGVWLGAVSDGQSPSTAGSAVFGHLSFFLVFFGLPLCLTLVALVGGVLLALEQRRGKPLPWYVRIVFPALLMAGVLPLIWHWFFGYPFASGLWLVLGLVAGALAASAYWKVIGTSDSNPAHEK